jgi:hypothetical protein
MNWFAPIFIVIGLSSLRSQPNRIIQPISEEILELFVPFPVDQVWMFSPKKNNPFSLANYNLPGVAVEEQSR